ncbi:MAG: hypothetical protein ACXWCY_22455 [Burkholderiales bacterium]
MKTGVERVPAWLCIGCGRIEGARPCIGVCQDRKAEFVHATDYDELADHTAALAAVVRRIATVTPREGEWERSYRALQAMARDVLSKDPGDI